MYELICKDFPRIRTGGSFGNFPKLKLCDNDSTKGRRRYFYLAEFKF